LDIKTPDWWKSETQSCYSITDTRRTCAVHLIRATLKYSDLEGFASFK